MAEIESFFFTPYETITDFTAGDKIDLSGMDANLNLAGDQAFSFLGAAGFNGVPGELRYEFGSLTGDIDGNSFSDFTIYLTGSPSLTAAAFVL